MENKFNDELFLVKASNLSLEDTFMKNLPKTDNERDLMISLAVIMKDAKDFYCFKRQSLVDGIGMVVGYSIIPDSLEGLSYNQWDGIARGMDYDRNSRIASKRDYTLLLGVLIKELIKCGWSIELAWDTVCNNSEKLFRFVEMTGDVPGLIDIVKFPKILAPTFHENTAFYLVNTAKNLYNFSCVTYEMSEYDVVMDTYFRDYIPPSTGNPYQEELDKLSKDAPDVKTEKRKQIAWIIMDV